MKRILSLFPVLVLCFALIVVPAFASELDSFELVTQPDRCETSGFYPGIYHMDIIYQGEVLYSEDNVSLQRDYLNFSFPVTVHDQSVDVEFSITGGDEVGWWIETCNVAVFTDSVTLRFSPQTSAPESSLSADLTAYFSAFLGWIAELLNVTTDSAALMLIVFGIPVLGFLVYLISRFKSM